MMNVRARELGLHHTHYTTPIGLDTPGNYSSPADLVKLAAYDLTESPYFARIVALRSAVLQSGDHIRYVVNRNDLVGKVSWIDGVKTGHTADAGYVLVASGHRDGMTLVSAVLGTASEAARDANTMALLDYGFDDFHMVTPVSRGAVLARPGVRDRPGRPRLTDRCERIHAGAATPRSGADPDPGAAAARRAVAASPRGRHGGGAGGRPSLARIPLLLANALPAVSGLTVAARFITKPLMLAVIAIAIGALTALVATRRRRARAGAADQEAA